MKRHTFLERPHTSLRAPRTCHFEPIETSWQLGRALALTASGLVSVAAIAALVLSFF